MSKLRRNNKREWFEKHRGEYVTNLLEPAEAFVLEFGAKLADIIPAVNAIPKVDKSIFRLYRDVRFSKEKSPFKTNLGLFFWEGNRKKMECPGYYVHVEPEQFFVAGGLYMFAKDQIAMYREKVDDAVAGKELAKIVKDLQSKHGLIMGGKNFKKVPRGFSPEHPRADLLKHDGLYAWSPEIDPRIFTDVDVVKHSFTIAKKMLPLHKWILRYILHE